MVVFYGTTGVPAIEPVDRTVDLMQAAFTRSEVDNYWAHNSRVVSPVPGSGGGQLRAVDFITAAEATRRLKPQLNDQSIDRSDDTLVCWAEVTGPLNMHISMPAFIRARETTRMIPLAEKGVLIFDAQTGNPLLLAFVSDRVGQKY